MAKTNLQVVGIGLFCLALLARQSGAYEFTVGGSTGWSLPSDPNVNILNQWAENNRFQINDTIVFAYARGNDSLLYVNQDDYKNCTTTSPIEKYVDGHTVFKFSHSGPFYFISGNRDNCLKNKKLVIVVMADRSKKSVTPPAPPSGPTGTSPPSPSPAPAEAQAPSSIEPPPGNNAGTVLVSLAGSFGAIVASSLFLAP